MVERYVRNVEAEGSSPFTSTARLGFARHSAMARCADVQLRDRPSRYPQGLSTEFIDALSRVPYAALCRRPRATPHRRWTFARSRPGRCGGAVCSRRRAMAAAMLKSQGWNSCEACSIAIQVRDVPGSAVHSRGAGPSVCHPLRRCPPSGRVAPSASGRST